MQLLPFDRCDGLRIRAALDRQGDRLEFTYELSGESADIVIPDAAAPMRAERLWRTTCFEAYLSVGKTSYVELDFSPSAEWCATLFSDYRQGMRQFELAAPEIRFAGDRLTAVVGMPTGASRGGVLGLAAAVEHRKGTRSYWALAHPRSNRPDFHARDCFIARLP